MKKLPFFLLLILLLEINISVESQSPALLKYVLQWPPTFCIKLNSEEGGRCKEPIPEHEFTLHGLMPADEEGNSIECDPGEDPNWDELFEPIGDELVTFWPSLREDFNEKELWKHEWRAHGACGGTTPQEYFERAIEINNISQEGNLFNYFETSGIFASDSLAYPKQEIVEAVQKVFDERTPLIRSSLSAPRRRPPPARSPPPRPRSPPPRSPPPRPRSPPPPLRSPPPRPRSPPPPPRSPPPRPRSPPPPPRSPPPRPRSPPPPPRSPPPRPRSPPPPPRSPPPRPRSPPPPPRSPPPPPRSPPPPPRSPPPPSPPPPSPSPPPPSLPPPPPPLNIYLTCIPINPENNTHVYLSEVTLCTNLDGTEYISCPSEAAPTSCPDEALIMLPHPQAQDQGPEDPPEDIWKTPTGHILRLISWEDKIFNG